MKRLAELADIMEQIEMATKLQTAGDWMTLLWEMDARRELHRLIFEA